MSIFKAVVLKGANQVKKDGTANIKIRLTHNRRIEYIPTDLYVRVKDMDSNTGFVKSGPSKDFINLRITTLLKNYREKDIILGDNRNQMTAGDIKKFLLEGKASGHEIDFFEFVEDYIKSVDVKGTAEQYSALVASLKNYSGDYLRVNEITLNYLLRYEAYLRKRGLRNGIINYMRTFRSLFNKCRDLYNNEDTGQILIPNYPFRKYKFPKRQNNSHDNVLTLDEIREIKTYVPANENEKFAKDIFLLMIYLVGIEAKDLFYAKKENQGRLNYIRYKTGRKYSIKIEPEAAEIIKYYKGEYCLLYLSEHFQHHKSFYRKINNYLVGEKSHNIDGILPKLGIKKKVTTKWARHTWATIARNDCRIDKDDVALCLGHEDADNRVTDIYIRYDYSIIDDSNRKVLDLLK